MSKVYNKLVRDKIPEIIQADSKTAKTRVLNDQDYLEALIKKLQEEVTELAAARNTEELADVHEVLIALAEALGIDHKELERVRKAKAELRGGFTDRVFLEEVSDGPS